MLRYVARTLVFLCLATGPSPLTGPYRLRSLYLCSPCSAESEKLPCLAVYSTWLGVKENETFPLPSIPAPGCMAALAWGRSIESSPDISQSLFSFPLPATPHISPLLPLPSPSSLLFSLPPSRADQSGSSSARGLSLRRPVSAGFRCARAAPRQAQTRARKD